MSRTRPGRLGWVPRPVLAAVSVLAVAAGARAGVDVAGRDLPVPVALALGVAAVAVLAGAIALPVPPAPVPLRPRRPPYPGHPFLRVSTLRDLLDSGGRSAERYQRTVHPLLVGLTRSRLARRRLDRPPPGVLSELLAAPAGSAARPLGVAELEQLVTALEQL